MDILHILLKLIEALKGVIPILNKFTKYKKNIVIESMAVYDTGKFDNYLEKSYLKSKELYSNLVENRLTIQNRGEENAIITSIILEKVLFERKTFDFIQYDGGFNNKNQTFNFYLINNGNKIGKSKEYAIRYIALGNDKENKEILLENSISKYSIEPGEVKVVEATDYEKLFLEYFQNNLDKKWINIEILCENRVIMDDSQYFIIEQNKFVKQLGGGVGGPFDSGKVIFRIDKNFANRRILEAKCNIELHQGNNLVNFYILSDESGELSYSCRLLSGKYTIKSEVDKEKVNMKIFIPHYNMFNNDLYGKFYYGLEEERIDKKISFNKNIIEGKVPSLIYNPYESVEELNGKNEKN